MYLSCHNVITFFLHAASANFNLAVRCCASAFPSRNDSEDNENGIYPLYPASGPGGDAGAMIGAERQWRQRMAGLRTGALVATGAAIFILSSMGTSSDSSGRNVAQIVCGIGFLGPG